MTLLTPREAAARLGVDVKTIYRWLRSGKLRAMRLAGTWRIVEADLAAVGVPATEKQLPADETAALRFAGDLATYVRWVRQIRDAAGSVARQSGMQPAAPGASLGASTSDIHRTADELLTGLERLAAHYAAAPDGRAPQH